MNVPGGNISGSRCERPREVVYVSFEQQVVIERIHGDLFTDQLQHADREAVALGPIEGGLVEREQPLEFGVVEPGVVQTQEAVLGPPDLGRAQAINGWQERRPWAPLSMPEKFWKIMGSVVWARGITRRVASIPPRRKPSTMIAPSFGFASVTEISRLKRPSAPLAKLPSAPLT